MQREPEVVVVGASFSGLAAGVIVDHFGYSAAFLAAGGAAATALMVFALWMPETAPTKTKLRRPKAGTDAPQPTDLAPA